MKTENFIVFSCELLNIHCFVHLLLLFYKSNVVAEKKYTKSTIAIQFNVLFIIYLRFAIDYTLISRNQPKIKGLKNALSVDNAVLFSKYVQSQSDSYLYVLTLQILCTLLHPFYYFKSVQFRFHVSNE